VTEFKHIIEVVKATTHGEWLKTHQNGFKNVNKIFKSKKHYNRKIKHKKKDIN